MFCCSMRNTETRHVRAVCSVCLWVCLCVLVKETEMALLCVTFKAGICCAAAQQSLWECLCLSGVKPECYIHMAKIHSQF